MATSSKIRFNLDTLREQAFKAMDEQIQVLEDYLAELDQQEYHLKSRVDAWRVQQSERVLSLADHLREDKVSDAELAGFKVVPIPSQDQFEARQVRGELRLARQEKHRIAAKSASLVPAEDGTIALTKTQLREFFGL